MKKTNLTDHIVLKDERSVNSYSQLLYRFQCSSSCVELRRAIRSDGHPSYLISESPRSKSSKWHQEVYYFDFSYLALDKFKAVCDFWLRKNLIF